MEGEVLFTSAPSAPDLGCFSAREAGGMPFCAGKDTFFCAEPPRNTFCAGFGVFFCPAGGWYLILRRKRCLFLPGRRVVSHSAPEKIPFPARNRPGSPSAQVEGRFSAWREGGIWRVWSFLLNLLDNAIFGL